MTDERLKAIEDRAACGVVGIDSEGGGPSGDARATCAVDIPDVVAEVRRLQAALESERQWVRALSEDNGKLQRQVDDHCCVVHMPELRRLQAALVESERVRGLLREALETQLLWATTWDVREPEEEAAGRSSREALAADAALRSKASQGGG